MFLGRGREDKYFELNCTKHSSKLKLIQRSWKLKKQILRRIISSAVGFEPGTGRMTVPVIGHDW